MDDAYGRGYRNGQIFRDRDDPITAPSLEFIMEYEGQTDYRLGFFHGYFQKFGRYENGKYGGQVSLR